MERFEIYDLDYDQTGTIALLQCFESSWTVQLPAVREWEGDERDLKHPEEILVTYQAILVGLQ